MIRSSLKRERRLRRKTHRRKATKIVTKKRFGPHSGMRNHLGTSANPITKPPRKNEHRPRNTKNKRRAS